MATNFPTSLDSLTNPTTGNPLSSPSHAGQHADANDAIEALEAKVGVNGSAVTTSHDYKIAALEANNSVTNARLRDSVATSVIGRSANSTGDPADIAAASDGQVLRRASGTLAFGQIATAGIADNAVDNTKIRDSAALSVIGNGTNATANPADIAAGTDGHVLRRSGTTLGFGQVATAGIANNAVTNDKLRDSSAYTVIGNPGGTTAGPIDISIAADRVIGRSGSGSLAGVQIVTNMITDGNVSTAKIASNAVDNTKIRDSAALSVIGRSANSTGDPADIAAGTDGHVLRRSGTTLGFGTVATAGITNGAITKGKISTSDYAGMGLVHLATATATSGSSLILGSLFSTSFQNYRIVGTITGTVASAYGLAFRMRSGTTDTTTGYYWGTSRVDIASGVMSTYRGSNVTYGHLGAIANNSGVAHFVFDFTNPRNAAFTGWSGTATDSRSASGYGAITVGGTLSNTTQYDGIRIAYGEFATATIGNLTVRIYGYNNG